MTRPRKVIFLIAAGLLALGLAMVAITLVVLPSDWFRAKVRDRIVFETERATGGIVEIGAFRFDWSGLSAEVSPFVLHGTEPPGQKPLFRAESVKIGLKIVSALQRDIDIDSLLVEKPQLNVLVDANGKTNFPEPKVKNSSEKNPVEKLVALSVRQIVLRDGEMHYGDRRTRIELQGNDLRAELNYDRIQPSYRGKLAVRELRSQTAFLLPVVFDVETNLAIFGQSIKFESVRLRLPESTIEANGELAGFKDPRLSMNVFAKGTARELSGPLKLPIEKTGNVEFAGALRYNADERLRIDGHATGTNLAVKQDRFRVSGIDLATDVNFNLDRAVFRNTVVHALGGVFRGTVETPRLQSYKASGTVAGISVKAVAQAAGAPDTTLAGTISGPLELSGTFNREASDLRVAGRFEMEGAQGGIPVSGSLDVAYDRRRAQIDFGSSRFETPSSRVVFSGALGQQLEVTAESRNLQELLPVAAAFSKDVPREIPVKLRPGGVASFHGMITGPLENARATGDVKVTDFAVENVGFDRFTASVDATQNAGRLTAFTLAQGPLRMSGAVDLPLNAWRLSRTGSVSGKIQADGARIQTLLKSVGRALPVDGVAGATVEVAGTIAEPKLSMRVSVDRPEIYGQKFDRFTADLRYAGTGIEVINGVAHLGAAQVRLAATYEHPVNDLTSGRLRFDTSTRDLMLQQMAVLQQRKPDVRGRFAVRATGSVNVRKGEIFPEAIDGDVYIRDLVVDERPVGSFSLASETKGQLLRATVAGNLRGAKLTGGWEVELEKDYQAKGAVEISPMPLSTVQDLVSVSRGREPLPLDGFVAGRVTFSGPAKSPLKMRAEISLPTLQVVPSRPGLTAAQIQELSFQNQGPVVLEYVNQVVQIKEARFSGRGTDLRGSGFIRLADRSPWDVKLAGDLNLAVLRNFNRDISSAGTATISAGLRGTLNDPQLSGRLELKQASLNVTDVPNGIDDANGLILFDSRRATIERLTGTTGGGKIQLSGFVGFGAPEFSYRLQGRADGVRVRYPEGVSTTLNAQLSLSGTSSHSLLAGMVTVRRAGFNPRTDVGGLLAGSAAPIATPGATNEFLRGMQLDVQVETVPNLQLQTALTSDLQAEADLRLRGSAAKPSLLGRILVNQGEIQFFGNKYTINRGEVGFFNPVAIEPVLDLDIETRVRGISVNITVSGSIKKLNVSYRSDPPLESAEIVALLAVGRAPASNSALAVNQTLATQSVLTTGGNSLLGQAIAAPVSGRLQRFFGVSRVRIDPQLTGLNAVPQARLTVEQQISRDITLTYITNLAQANQQIIRLEWDISRNWSVVALREENGVFGVDFFFKKRFR